MRYDVSFIIVNFNTKALLSALVDSLREMTFSFRHHIIVVDNGSTDGSLDSVPPGDDVYIVSNGKNLGYGAAANIGIRHSEARYFCVLNTDVIISSIAIQAVYNCMEKKPEVALATPIVLNRDSSLQGFVFDFSCLAIYSEFAAKVLASRCKKRLLCSDGVEYVQGIAGAFMFMRSAIEGVRMEFDEQFFFYYEDTDLSYRVWRSGHRCAVVTAASIIHLGGQSSASKNIRLFYEGKYKFMNKHFGAYFARRVAVIDLCRAMVKKTFYAIARYVTPTQRLEVKLLQQIELCHYITGVFFAKQ